MNGFAELLHQLNARWWFRIIFFLTIVIVCSIAIINFNPNPGALEYLFFFTFLLASIITEITREKGVWYSFGIRPDIAAAKEAFAGMAFAFGPLSFIIVSSVLLGGEMAIAANLPDITGFISFTGLIFVMAATEEFIFRGIIFQALIDRFNPYFIIIISSVLFSAVHLVNPHISNMALLNIFLANMLMSAMYYSTRSLWAPISFHFFWNWAQHLFLGSNISGNDFDASIFILKTNGEIWAGGIFGVEEGLAATITILISIPLAVIWLKPSPFIMARLFKRNYAESSLLYKSK